MIVLQAEARAALGLIPSISVTEQARLMLAMHAAQAGVIDYLKYDPEQRLGAAEYYPRADSLMDYDHIGEWNTNSQHTKAVFQDTRGVYKFLQLARLPVRAVTDLRVDYAARHGQQDGDFASETAWSAGDDYHIEWDEQDVCRSGCLIAVSAWPATLGTVKVTYRAGYSPDEFSGPAEASSVASDGTITTVGVDASPIKVATMLAIVAKYHTFAAFSKSQLTGLLIPGPKQSERMGDYSYSLASGQAAALITGMGIALPPECQQYLESFAHRGLMSLG